MQQDHEVLNIMTDKELD